MQVRDFIESPMPMLHVIRNQPERASLKAPKSGKSRKLPIPDYLVPVIGRPQGAGALFMICGIPRPVNGSSEAYP